MMRTAQMSKLLKVCPRLQRTKGSSFVVFLLFWVLSPQAHGWGTLPKLDCISNKVARDVVAAACIGGSVLLTPLCFEQRNDFFFRVPPAIAATDLLGGLDEKQLQQSLKPATEARPQITLPSRGNVPTENLPIVEGLISLASPNGELRPRATDSLVITFRTVSQPEVVLGGARIPVSKAARFPLAFRLFPKNLLQEQQETWNKLQNSVDGVGDILVQVLVCSEDNPNCSESRSRMRSRGVAKSIRNLPGQLQDQTIRAPAALRLQ